MNSRYDSIFFVLHFTSMEIDDLLDPSQFKSNWSGEEGKQFSVLAVSQQSNH